VAALARRTWATAQQTPQLFASLEWWRAYYHFVRPHASLQVALMQPRERGGKRLARRYRQRTPAMAAGRTKRRWTARELLSCPLPPVCAWAPLKPEGCCLLSRGDGWKSQQQHSNGASLQGEMTSPDCPLTKKSAKQDLQRLLELSTMSNSCTHFPFLTMFMTFSW